MDLSIRDDDLRKAEKEMVKEFTDRNLSKLSTMDMDFDAIILAFLDWQYRRYKVQELEDMFLVIDFEQNDLVAIVSKKDPNAYQDAYNLCDRMNSYKPFDLFEELKKKKKEEENGVFIDGEKVGEVTDVKLEVNAEDDEDYKKECGMSFDDFFDFLTFLSEMMKEDEE